MKKLIAAVVSALFLINNVWATQIKVVENDIITTSGTNDVYVHPGISASPNDNILDIYGRIDVVETSYTYHYDHDGNPNTPDVNFSFTIAEAAIVDHDNNSSTPPIPAMIDHDGNPSTPDISAVTPIMIDHDDDPSTPDVPVMYDDDGNPSTPDVPAMKAVLVNGVIPTVIDGSGTTPAATASTVTDGKIYADDLSTVGNAYGAYITTTSGIASANNNKVNLYPKDPSEGGSAGAMVSGDVIGAYIDSNESTIATNAQNNVVNWAGARAGADEDQWRAHGAYGAIIEGTGSSVQITGGVKNNKVIYDIEKDIVILGGGAIVVSNGGTVKISGSAEGNQVDLNNGDGKDVGINIFGGLIYSASYNSGNVEITDTANVIDNIVNLTGGTTIQQVIAGGIQVNKKSQSGATTISGSVKGNKVNISGGTNIFGSINAGLISASNLTGALTIDGEVSGNTVDITGGTLKSTPIYAGRIEVNGLNTTGTVDISGEIKNNTVNSGGEGLRAIFGGSLEVYGISGAGTFNITGDVSGNTINRDGGRAGNIYVSYTETSGQTLNITSNADNNVLNVSDQAVTGNESYLHSISGAYVEIEKLASQGSADSINITSGAHGNIVNIDGAEITRSSIFGGYVRGSNGTVTDNIVNISGNTTFNDVVLLYGGYTNGLGMVSDNILNLGTSGLTAYGIGAFNKINFDLSNAAAGNTILTVTHGNGEGHPIFGNLINGPDNGAIDLSNVTIGLIEDTARPDIKLSDRITLIAETSNSGHGFSNFISQTITRTAGNITYSYKTIVNNNTTTTTPATEASTLDLFHNKIETTGNWTEDIVVKAGAGPGEDVELKVAGKLAVENLTAESNLNSKATITSGSLDVTAQDTIVNLADTAAWDNSLQNGIYFGDIFIGYGHTLEMNLTNAAYSFGNNFNVIGADNKFVGDLDLSGKNINFYVEDHTPANATMLDVSGAANIANSHVVLSSAGSSTLLQVGDRINLLKATDITGTPADQTGTGVFGYTINAALDFVLNSDTLYAVIKEVTADKKTKALSEGITASLAFVGQGSELAAQDGVISAVGSAENSQGFAAFSAGAMGKSKYETGSYADVKGVSFMAGLAKAFDNSTLGLFLEYGNGNYNTENTFGVDTVKGKGNVSYTGGGVLGKVNNEDNYYFDFSGRVGNVKTNFNSADYISGGVAVGYDYDVPYFGGHIGAGYLGQKLASFDLDIYGKYLFAHQGGKEVALPTNQTINFESNSSHRLRLGVKIMRGQKSVFNPYAGIAYDYEFAGEANATVDGLAVLTPSLKGGTEIGELGLQINHNYFGLDFGAQGYTGKRKGLSGSFKLSYKF
ncbi:MAG: hypothetical protein LBG46_05715 [Elusimicrobiota bacterium]|jgi:hypothetical protein|nr:hypothetical protein [Elusimicrobiota bacterium]